MGSAGVGKLLRGAARRVIVWRECVAALHSRRSAVPRVAMEKVPDTTAQVLPRSAQRYSETNQVKKCHTDGGGTYD